LLLGHSSDARAAAQVFCSDVIWSRSLTDDSDYYEGRKTRNGDPRGEFARASRQGVSGLRLTQVATKVARQEMGIRGGSLPEPVDKECRGYG
jgi:hypothetical protein